MGFRLLSTPKQTIKGTGLTSKWVATDSPVEFKLQRVDAFIASQSIVSGFLRVTYSGAASNLVAHTGDKVLLLNSALGYYAYATVSAVSGLNVTTSLAFTASDSRTFDTLVFYDRALNYFFEALLYVNGVQQSYPIEVSPDPLGRATLDVSGYLYAYVSSAKSGEYLRPFTAEVNQSGHFELDIRDNFLGATSTEYYRVPDTYYYVKAIRTMEQGGNLSEFVPNLAAKSKFFNAYETPPAAFGLPFDISFIYSELLAGKTVQLKEEYYDSQNTKLGDKTTNVSADQIGRLVSYSVDTTNINPLTSRIKLQLLTDDATPPVEPNTWYITTDPFSPSYPLKFVKTGSSVAVTGKFMGYGDPALPNAVLTPTGVITLSVDQSATVPASAWLPQRYKAWRLLVGNSDYAAFTADTYLKVTAIGLARGGLNATTTRQLLKSAIRNAEELATAVWNALQDVVLAMNSQAGGAAYDSYTEMFRGTPSAVITDNDEGRGLALIIECGLNISLSAAATPATTADVFSFGPVAFTSVFGQIKPSGSCHFNRIEAYGLQSIGAAFSTNINTTYTV